MIAGLRSFSSKVHIVYLAAAAGNPFADWLLLRVEQLNEEAETRLAQSRQSIKATVANLNLEDRSNYERFREHSVTPVRVESRHGHYFSMGLRLLARFDAVVLLARSLFRHTLLSREETFTEIDQCAAKVRAVYATTNVWPVGMPYCDRTQLKNNTPAAQAAVVALGKSGFLNLADYPDMNEVYSFFVTYATRPKYGPVIQEGDRL